MPLPACFGFPPGMPFVPLSTSLRPSWPSHHHEASYHEAFLDHTRLKVLSCTHCPGHLVFDRLPFWELPWLFVVAAAVVSELTLQVSDRMQSPSGHSWGSVNALCAVREYYHLALCTALVVLSNLSYGDAYVCVSDEDQGFSLLINWKLIN